MNAMRRAWVGATNFMRLAETIYFELETMQSQFQSPTK